jgi:hypothetical protein
MRSGFWVPLLTELTMVRMQIRYMMHLSNLSGPASTTLALLGSSLSAKHDAFRNRKLLREKIREKKDEKVPAGYQWQGK